MIHAGDFDSWETYEEFKKRFPTYGVVGNRDDFGACEEIPERRIVQIGGFAIGVTHGCGAAHGLPERVRNGWTDEADLVIFGHSHQPGIQVIQGLKLLNPGSPTDVLCAERQTYALIDVGKGLEITIHELPA